MKMSSHACWQNLFFEKVTSFFFSLKSFQNQLWVLTLLSQIEVKDHFCPLHSGPKMFGSGRKIENKNFPMLIFPYIFSPSCLNNFFTKQDGIPHAIVKCSYLFSLTSNKKNLTLALGEPKNFFAWGVRQKIFLRLLASKSSDGPGTLFKKKFRFS